MIQLNALHLPRRSKSNLLETAVALSVILGTSLAAAEPVGTSFTYQGVLKDEPGNPRSGSFDFVFELHDDPLADSPVGPTLAEPGVTVTKGVFIVELDFGAVFDGTDLWLEIEADGALLSPRQHLTGRVGSGSEVNVAGTVNTSLGYKISDILALDIGADTSGVFVGNSAGSLGFGSVFIGNFAGEVNTVSGDRNVFIGEQAGRSNMTGRKNVYIGQQAGANNASGSANVMIGEDSGLNNTNGEGNIFIGKESGANSTGSNQLYITNSDDSSPLIHGDFSTDDLTINGDLTVTGTCIGCSSDRELKRNIEPLSDSLGKISRLNGVAYDWREDVREAKYYPGPQIGILGQEVEAVFPELVGIDSRGYRFVRYQKLVAPLIEAVKELKAQNEALRAENDIEIAELKAQNEAIKALLCLDHPLVALCQLGQHNRPKS